MSEFQADRLISVEIGTLTGKKIHFNDLHQETTIGDIKLLIFQKEQIEPKICRLIGDGRNCCPSQKLSTISKNNENIIVLHMVLKLGCGATPPATLLKKVVYPSIQIEYLDHILTKEIRLREWDIELSKIVCDYAKTCINVVDIVPRCMANVGRMYRKQNSDNYCMHCKHWTYDKPVIDVNKMPYLQFMHASTVKLIFCKYTSVYNPDWTMKIDINSLNNANVTDFIQITTTGKDDISFPLKYTLDDKGDIDDATQFMTLKIHPVSFAQKKIKTQIVIKESTMPMIMTLPHNDRGGILGETVLEHFFFQF
eukprot:538377_1